MTFHVAIESAYWDFLARVNGHGKWGRARQSQRDAFKQAVAGLLFKQHEVCNDTLNLALVAIEARGSMPDPEWDSLRKCVLGAIYATLESLPEGFRTHSERIAELERDPQTKATLDAARKRLHAKSDTKSADAIKLEFPTALRKMWSGTEVQEWLDNLPPMYYVPPTTTEEPTYPNVVVDKRNQLADALSLAVSLGLNVFTPTDFSKYALVYYADPKTSEEKQIVCSMSETLDAESATIEAILKASLAIGSRK